MTEAPAVRLRGVERRYGHIVALEALDLDVEDGEFFSLIGPSGCGKTTTLRLIAGLERPTAGSVLIKGRDVSALPAHRRPVNTVFQQYALFPHLDVAGNVGFGLRERRVPRAEARRRVAAMIELVGLDGRERAKPRQLSGGQQQRVALARALVLEPDVLLLDEPLAALDLRLRRQMQDLLKSIRREVGVSFVFVTHDQEEAFSMSDRVGVMNAGRLEQVGAPRDAYDRPATRFVADFVGARNLFPGSVSRVLGDGRYSVEVGALGAREVSGPPGMAAGTAVGVIVRPEAVSFGDAPRDSAVTVRGRVADASYSGPQTLYTVEVAGLGALRALVHGDPVRAIPGEEHLLSWQGGAMWAVPDEGDGPDPADDAGGTT